LITVEVGLFCRGHKWPGKPGRRSRRK